MKRASLVLLVLSFVSLFPPAAGESKPMSHVEVCKTDKEAAKEICGILFDAAAAGLIVLERGSKGDGVKRAHLLCNVSEAQAEFMCSHQPN